MANEKVYKKEGSSLLIETVVIEKHSRESLSTERNRLQEKIDEIDFLLKKCDELDAKVLENK